MTAIVEYEGNLRCNAEHLQSGSKMETDAPTDNRGKGERFSPTDTLCVSLATCMLTTMGIKANDSGYNIDGARAEVTKHMASEPRRVSAIDVRIKLPAQKDVKSQQILERIGYTCPVARSLHPDILLNLEYIWEG